MHIYIISVSRHFKKYSVLALTEVNETSQTKLNVIKNYTFRILLHQHAQICINIILKDKRTHDTLNPFTHLSSKTSLATKISMTTSPRAPQGSGHYARLSQMVPCRSPQGVTCNDRSPRGALHESPS